MPSPSFWAVVATYAGEIAPTSGPLLTAVSETAHAIDRAGTRTQLPEPVTELIAPPAAVRRPQRRIRLRARQ